MKKEDLIKKLEKTEFPKIEIPSHRKRLKQALIEWKYDKGARQVFVGLKKALIPLGVTTFIIIAVLIASNLITPQYTLAEVENIAKENPQIKELMEKKNAEIKDIEIIENKAYILLSYSEAEKSSSEKTELEEEKFTGALVELELKKREVSNIRPVKPKVIPLTQEEEKETEEIIKKSEFAENNSKNIKVERIETIPIPVHELEIIKKNNKVELSPKKEEKEVRIIYESQGEKKEARVDLKNGEIKTIKILEEK